MHYSKGVLSRRLYLAITILQVCAGAPQQCKVNWARPYGVCIGKTSVSWPRSIGTAPAFYDYLKGSRPVDWTGPGYIKDDGTLVFGHEVCFNPSRFFAIVTQACFHLVHPRQSCAVLEFRPRSVIHDIPVFGTFFLQVHTRRQ